MRHEILETSDNPNGPLSIRVFQNLVATARSPDRTMARLAQWVLDNQTRVANLAISSVAQEADVSEATVYRFCKLLGLAGYKDLRYALAEGRGLALGAQLANLEPEHDEHNLASVMRRVIQANAEALLKTMSLLSLLDLQKAVDELMSADYVHLVGFGASAPVVFDAQQRLLSLGLMASVTSDAHVAAATAANARAGAIFFGISCSGRTRDLVEVFEAAGARGLKRLAITSDPKSPLTRVSDVVLISAVRRSPIAHETIGTRTSQLAIVEMLCDSIALQHPDQERLNRGFELLDAEIARKRVPTG